MKKSESMRVNGKHYRTIWEVEDGVEVIDQRQLPHIFKTAKLKSVDDFCFAIKDMLVRGAPLIGVTAAYAMHSAAIEAKSKSDFNRHLTNCANKLKSTRPTAINLAWAVDCQLSALLGLTSNSEKIEKALEIARKITEDDIDCSKAIGEAGLKIIEEISKKKKREVVNILTHCNAGWLATVDWGTATAPIYAAHRKGIEVHIWIDETRPRNQGAKLTAFELFHENVPNTLIVDNAGGLLMQKGLVDLVLVGSDRTSANGDLANKIGTYLKALAAFDNRIPFYACLPSSTIDWDLKDGISEIPIEERSAEEVKYMDGKTEKNIQNVLITLEETRASNFAFDITPARLVTGLISERGICNANRESILKLFPERAFKNKAINSKSFY